MIVYIFYGYTGEYLREYTPQINPKKSGEYLMPRFSTLKKPVFKDGFYPVFDGDKWNQIPDYRGFEVVNLETEEISQMEHIGEIPEGYMLYDEFIETDEYKAKEAAVIAFQEKQQLLDQIDELDKKRIRAVCEPSQKDENQTWLEYYTNQIIELRQQLQEL